MTAGLLERIGINIGDLLSAPEWQPADATTSGPPITVLFVDSDRLNWDVWNAWITRYRRFKPVFTDNTSDGVTRYVGSSNVGLVIVSSRTRFNPHDAYPEDAAAAIEFIEYLRELEYTGLVVVISPEQPAERLPGLGKRARVLTSGEFAESIDQILKDVARGKS